MSTKAKNHRFFSNVVKEVEKLTITQIIGKYTKVKFNCHSDDDALCPFHGDVHYGNFKISRKKNICKCFTCGYYGDGIQFVKDLFKVPFKPAVLRIAIDHNIITEEQAESYLGGKVNNTKVHQVQYEKEKEKENGITEIAIPSTRNIGYQLFMMGTSLSDKHREYLRNRGLSDEEIEEKGFFTFPFPSKKFLDDLHERCRKAGISYNVFKRIPGFYTTENLALDSFQPKTGEREYRYTFARHFGIGIPTKDAYGNIVGIQIRKDSKNTKKKYTWFSSSYAAYDDNDYIFGTAAGTPTHVAYPKVNKYPNVVFVTEGFFKAEEVAKTFGVTCISVSGVGNYKSIVDDLKAIQAVKKNKIEHLYVAYDADMCHNIQVYKHSKGMVELIKSEFQDVHIYMALWKESDGKGVDDLILNGKAHTLRKVDFDDFAELYDVMIEKLEKEYKRIQKIPKKVVENSFCQEIFPKVYTA